MCSQGGDLIRIFQTLEGRFPRMWKLVLRFKAGEDILDAAFLP